MISARAVPMDRAGARALRAALPLALAAALAMLASTATTTATASITQARADDPIARASVVSGTPADATLFPYLAALKSGADIFCGGSLIAPDRVLTAAHCIEDMVVGDQVVVGPADARTVLHLAQDPRLTAQTDAGRSSQDVLPYDVAILQLNAPVTDIAPLRLAQATDAALYAPGALLTTAGYGSTDRQGHEAGVLRYAQVQARADADCMTLLAPLGAAKEFVASSMLCTTDPDNAPPYRSSCYGDSGTPLIAQASDGSLVQVGVDNWGVACGYRNGDPENYTEVPAVAAFALSPAPVLRPEPIGRPKLTGTAKVGRKLRCSKPLYNDPQPDRTRRAFFIAAGSSSRIVASGSGSYRIPRSMRGRLLSCLVLAHSAGGEIISSATTGKRVR